MNILKIKHLKNLVLVMGLFLVLGSLSSCAAMRAKRCKCYKWSVEEVAPEHTPVQPTEVEVTVAD